MRQKSKIINFRKIVDLDIVSSYIRYRVKLKYWDIDSILTRYIKGVQAQICIFIVMKHYIHELKVPE